MKSVHAKVNISSCVQHKILGLSPPPPQKKVLLLIGTPEDERIVETFEETPYYLMARKEDQALMDQIDEAMDERQHLQAHLPQTAAGCRPADLIPPQSMIRLPAPADSKSLPMQGSTPFAQGGFLFF